MSLTLYTNNVLAKYALIHAYDTSPASFDKIEYLYDASIPFFDVYLSKEQRKDIKVIVPSDGEYTLPIKFNKSNDDDEYDLCLKIESFFTPDGRVVQDRESSEIIKRVQLSVGERTMRSWDVKSWDVESELLTRFVSDAKQSVERKLRDYKTHATEVLTKYVFNDKFMEWTVLSKTPKRDMDSVYLEAGTKSTLLGVIDEFVHPDTQKEYYKFSIPYKCNVMLYGKPGTGKTSTIHAIASRINADVYLLQFTARLDDTTLVNAFNSSRFAEDMQGNAKRNRIIVMEDVDCIFSDRKQHDTQKNAVTMSGLLNVMDGMLRVDGLIVFMTANNIDAIDAALLRPSRIDLLVEYHLPNKAQVRDMYRAFLPDQADSFDAFYDKIQYKSVSTSALQQFLFRYRKCENVLALLPKLYEIASQDNDRSKAKSNSKDDSKQESMYM